MTKQKSIPRIFRYVGKPKFEVQNLEGRLKVGDIIHRGKVKELIIGVGKDTIKIGGKYCGGASIQTISRYDSDYIIYRNYITTLLPNKLFPSGHDDRIPKERFDYKRYYKLLKEVLHTKTSS
ncbi:hypothetical protein J4229_02195 [Candidatus Pacearchaeota archaeon]|nr:hypothetical protein [Candidatus Pacearchaeota archaeon]